MAVSYAVPLKSGALDTIVLSPYVDIAPGVDERIVIRRGMLRAMDNQDLRVVAKRNNTMRFLDHVEEMGRAG